MATDRSIFPARDLKMLTWILKEYLSNHLPTIKTYRIVDKHASFAEGPCYEHAAYFIDILFALPDGKKIHKRWSIPEDTKYTDPKMVEVFEDIGNWLAIAAESWRVKK